MKRSNKTAFALLAALAIAVGLAACGSSSDETNEATTGATTRPADHPKAPAWAARSRPSSSATANRSAASSELEYDAGDEIRFEVNSDVADEVHVHGYDLMQDVPAGGTVSFDFPAEIEGIFEAELEGRKEQIAELRVNP